MPHGQHLEMRREGLPLSTCQAAATIRMELQIYRLETKHLLPYTVQQCASTMSRSDGVQAFHFDSCNRSHGSTTGVSKNKATACVHSWRFKARGPAFSIPNSCCSKRKRTNLTWQSQPNNSYAPRGQDLELLISAALSTSQPAAIIPNETVGSEASVCIHL